MNKIVEQLRKVDVVCMICSDGPLMRDAANEIDRLEAELDERTKAARYITCCLGGAGDDSEDGWDHDNIRCLFDHVCEKWPWCDPRKAADNPEGP